MKVFSTNYIFTSQINTPIKHHMKATSLMITDRKLEVPVVEYLVGQIIKILYICLILLKFNLKSLLHFLRVFLFTSPTLPD